MNINLNIVPYGKCYYKKHIYLKMDYNVDNSNIRLLRERMCCIDITMNN